MNEVAFDFSCGIAPVSPPSGRGGLGASGFAPSPHPSPKRERQQSTLRECPVCDQAKPAKEFRSVVGRITTEACGECCDLRDEVSPDPLGPATIATFCLRVAVKRFERRTMLLPRNESQKKKESALAKDPKEYAKWLQRLPDRIAAIVAKTVAVKGDAFQLDDDVALILILDELNAGDSTLIERNANKKLVPKRRN